MIAKTNGGFLISQIKQISGRIFEKLLLDAGIGEFNGAQGRILYILWQEDNIPIVELAKKTGLAKTTLTSMLDRMESAKLVARTYDSVDRRQVRIILTERAQMLNDAYKKVSADMSDIFYAGFSDEEIISFEKGLRRILGNLKESEKTYEK